MHQILPISGINKFYPEHFIKIPNFLVLLALMLLKIVGIFILSCSVYTALAVIILVISDNKVII